MKAHPLALVAAAATAAGFVLTLLATVPFVGHVKDGVLFCNAPCVVVRDGVEVYRSATAVETPFDGDGEVRQVK